jgi:SAM-dependent methyltransferase
VYAAGVDERHRYGLDVPSGGEHHRAYVGPPASYDLIAALAAGLLFAAGLRETHRLLDVGCGSLRVGRLLIAYLRPEHYFGIEPERAYVEEGIAKETGRDLVEMKRPAFRYVSDFSADGFGVPFDYILAQSIFSHTYPDLAAVGFSGIARALAPDGVLLATFFEGEPGKRGSGWLYPEAVPYEWAEVRRMARDAGLVARRVRWPHPLQGWFVAGLPSAREKVDALAHGLRPPLKPGAGTSPATIR